MPSAHDIQWSLMTDTAQVHVGDLVSTEAGGMPIYQVMALAGDAAWLGGERRPTATLMPLSGFRWRGQFA